jgi:hypothetical protein
MSETNPTATLKATGQPFEAAGEVAFDTIKGFTMRAVRRGEEIETAILHEGRQIGGGSLYRMKGQRYEGQITVHGAYWWCAAVRDVATMEYRIELSAKRVPLSVADTDA